MSAMRLLMVVGSSRGGAAVHVRELVRRIPSDRYAVRVALPEDGGDVLPAELRAAGAQVTTVPLAGGPAPRAVRLLEHLARGADLVHVHGPRAALYGRTALEAMGGARPRLVYTVHAFAAPHYDWARRTALLALERRLQRWTDATIAVSNAERDALADAGLASAETIHVIYNGVDLDRFHPASDAQRAAARQALGLAADQSVAMMVCRLYRPRDFETLLVAFRQVREQVPRARLVIVGDGPWRARVAELVDGLWLGQQVTLAGRREDVPDLLGAADLLVHATAGWEGMGLSILEAMAAGLPVVASRVGGIPEAVVDGETGILVPPGSPAALARALEAVLGDPALGARMGASGRARAEVRFTLPRMVAETLAVYERVLRAEGAGVFAGPAGRT